MHVLFQSLIIRTPIPVVSASTPTAMNNPGILQWAAIAGGGCLMCIVYRTCDRVIVTLTRSPQYHQTPRLLPLSCRYQKWSIPHVPSAALAKDLANIVVALAAVLGSRSAELPATHNLIILGPRVSRLVKVGGGESEFVPCIVLGIVALKHFWPSIYPHLQLN